MDKKAEAIASAFEYLAPVDVAIVNEAVTGLVERLAARLQWEHTLFQRLLTVKDEGYGNAVISRLPFEDPAAHVYEGTEGETRGYARVTVRPGAEPVTIFGTHLSVAAHARLAQARALAEEAAPTGDRVVVAGDFNIAAKPGNELGGGDLVWQAMDTRGFMRADDYGEEAAYGPTFGHYNQIDLIWLKKNALARPALSRLGDRPPVGVGTFGATRASFPSDHRGVIARLIVH